MLSAMLGFYRGMPTTIHSMRDLYFVPGWLSEDNAHPLLKQCDPSVELFESFWDFCLRKHPKKIVLYRTYALGDILMLLPIVRAMRRTLALTEPVYIVMEDRFVAQLDTLPESSGVRCLLKRGPRADYGGDVHFDLDACLEVDHHGGPASHTSRLDLYAAALGVELSRA